MSQETFDFVLVTEVKNREFDTNALLAYELERRGYKVRILQTWEETFHKHKPIKTKVVVSWSMYNNNTFRNIASYVTGCNKMINMQREQLLSNFGASNMSENVLLGVHGKAKEVAHLAWGNHTKRRLIEYYHVPEKNVALTGDITLDLYYGKLKKLTISREKLCRRYNIDPTKRITIFISSFTLNELPDKSFEDLNLNDSDIELKRNSVMSRNEIIKWIEQILPQYEGVFIYRPHPAEKGNLNILELEKKYDNFRVIGGESIRHWIFAADKIYSWWSTSIKEIYAAKKTCEILRPFKIQDDIEIQILNDANFVTNYDTFYRNFYKETDFPVDEETMRDFILLDEKTPAYVKIADFFEKVFKSEEYYIDFDESLWVKKYMDIFIYNFKMDILKLFFFCFRNVPLSSKGKLGSIIENFKYMKEMKDNNYFSNEEYLEMKEKISLALEQL